MPTAAVLEITGCLTETGCQALLPIIRRAGVLREGLLITVNLCHARHVDAGALEFLQDASHGLQRRSPYPGLHDFHGTIAIDAPPVLPGCPALRPLRRVAVAAAA
ncbi:MAG TPA: hypothetical protein VGN49_01680 [Micrococcaceae bacterium]|jgi:hypothetical protein|nr:hypothetical protein [Micrococcaceae bacterium]